MLLTEGFLGWVFFGIGSTLIDAHTLPGQTEGLKGWLRRDGWMGGWYVRYGWIGGRREKVRGVYRFSFLVKQNKKAKICFVIYIAGFFKFFFVMK